MNNHSSFGYDEHTNSAQGAQGGNRKQKKSNSEDKTKQSTTAKQHGQNLLHPEEPVPSRQPVAALLPPQLRASPSSNTGLTPPLPSSSPSVPESVPLDAAGSSQSNQPPVSEPYRGNENGRRTCGSFGTQRFSPTVVDLSESITTKYSEEGHADNIETCFNCEGQLNKGSLEDMRSHMRCRPAMPRPNNQRNEEPSGRTQGPLTQTLFGNNGGYHNE